MAGAKGVVLPKEGNDASGVPPFGNTEVAVARYNGTRLAAPCATVNGEQESRRPVQTIERSDLLIRTSHSQARAQFGDRDSLALCAVVARATIPVAGARSLSAGDR